jgi:hypothetical protein
LAPIGVIHCKTSQKPEKLGRIQVSRTLLTLRTSLSRSRNCNQQRPKPCQRPFPQNRRQRTNTPRLRPPPSPPLLPSGPTREEGTATNPGRPPGPSRSPRFGSGCLATRKPRTPTPANPGSNALQKGRTSVCPDLTSPARRIAWYPLALASARTAPAGQQRIPQN